MMNCVVLLVRSSGKQAGSFVCCNDGTMLNNPSVATDLVFDILLVLHQPFVMHQRCTSHAIVAKCVAIPTLKHLSVPCYKKTQQPISLLLLLLLLPHIHQHFHHCLLGQPHHTVLRTHHALQVRHHIWMLHHEPPRAPHNLSLLYQFVNGCVRNRPKMTLYVVGMGVVDYRFWVFLRDDAVEG